MPAINPLAQFVLSYWPLILFLLLLADAAYLRHLHPLSKVPGPYIASVTRFWQLAVFLQGRQHWVFIDLHRRYGPIVRIGPNSVIIQDSAHFSEYFNWDKSPWWLAFRGSIHDIPHGNELDIEKHKVKKRNVMGAYTISAVVKNELKMDGHISELMSQFARRANTIFDFAPWAQWAAFDIAMEMVFSSPAGFVKAGYDVDDLCKSIRELLTSANISATFPIIAKIVYLPFVFPYLGPKPTDKTGPGRCHKYAYDQVRKRFSSDEPHSDILQWIIDHEDKSGERLSYAMLEQEALSPVFAGSDSTAMLLRVMTLQIATNPRVYAKLMAQIDAADHAGHLSDIPQYGELRQHVPYLDSLLRESLRIYPIVGSPIYRSVPSSGVTIDGHFIPGGTDLGISQWAVARNRAIFGDDADLFRPERWTDDVSLEAKKKRDSGDVFFGGGPTMCTGRNVAQLEAWKIITELFRRFDIQVVNSTKPWEEVNRLAMMSWDFFVRMTPREKPAKV